MKAKKEPKELFEAIKAGTLKVTQVNAKAVKNAYCDSVMWNTVFEKAGLKDLPDPDDVLGRQQVFEDWLADAYAGNFDDSIEKARAALHTVRDKIVDDVVSGRI